MACIQVRHNRNPDDTVRYDTDGSAAQTCASAKDDVKGYGKMACTQCSVEIQIHTVTYDTN